MTRKLIKNIFILIIFACAITQVHANSFLQKESILIIFSVVSAKNPEPAAAIDLLGMLSVPQSPEYRTPTEKYIAMVGLGALSYYNYNADEDQRTEKEIFWTNLIVFNAILARDLFGAPASTLSFKEEIKPKSSFNFQVSPSGESRFVWGFKF
jgi:hypothetical protein